MMIAIMMVITMMMIITKKKQIVYLYLHNTKQKKKTLTLSLSGKTEHFRAICSPSALTSTSSQIIRNAYFNPTIFPIIIQMKQIRIIRKH